MQSQTSSTTWPHAWRAGAPTTARLAIVGWLALVPSPSSRRHGRSEGDRLRDLRSRRVGARQRDPLRGLRATRRRKRPDREPDARRHRRGVPGGDRGRQRRSPARRGRVRRVAVDRRTPDISADQATALVPLNPRGRRRRRGQDRRGPRRSPRSRRHIPTSTSARSATSTEQGAQRLVRGRPEGRPVLGAADAAHPADRVRGSRRGRDPVAARADRRARDAGPGLDREPRGPDGRDRRRSCC